MKMNVDKAGERLLRKLAGHSSRRGMLARLGAVIVAAPVLPLLPVSRAEAAKPDRSVEGKTLFARTSQTKDDTKCDYWRYCAISGSLCSCCGGGVSTCPAGSQASPVSWVGTCINPADGKAYMIAYRDCCGLPGCGQCSCKGTDRETPIYVPQLNNSTIWCFGTDSMQYHCSTAALISPAQ